jgi:5-methyltetrahydrofolate--homocysteine methyltransferase
METVLQSPSGQRVVISPSHPVVMIGERINPSGGRRKELAAQLAAGDMTLVREEARRQVAAGAGVIDVNVQSAQVRDEAAALVQAVEAVAQSVDVPICIDTNDGAALAAALRICPGRPLVNSVTGEEASLARVLPLVAEHHAAVIAMAMDDGGIPAEPRQRLAIAERIVRRAETFGIAPADILMDSLTLSVGADAQAAAVTLETIRLIRENLGLNLTLGASNVSFGLPLRQAINAGFLYMAIAAGVNCPIVDPTKMRETVLVANLLRGADPHAGRFLAYYRECQRAQAAAQ